MLGARSMLTRLEFSDRIRTEAEVTSTDFGWLGCLRALREFSFTITLYGVAEAERTADSTMLAACVRDALRGCTALEKIVIPADECKPQHTDSGEGAVLPVYPCLNKRVLKIGVAGSILTNLRFVMRAKGNCYANACSWHS